MLDIEALGRVDVVPYDPAWRSAYAEERSAIMGVGGSAVLELEHIGSTAVPGLWAKPIIDMMAAAADLGAALALASRLAARGYQLIETGMTDRLFLRRRAEDGGQIYQLHIVERSAWDERKERLMRDHLLQHPDAVAAYSALKVRLASQYAEESLAYTKAKTAFIQGLVDKARADLGLASIDVWTEQPRA
ncbi:GrpB family protein [uncultured Phenylobacterium sp.]|uniref:GrpB family protein n=1 Tax=uncultured Phenylobacterium sp. TaxID=349273 RepID=UPI0025DCF2B3|nr:GrpB family protein [uncultured Phenylobacterium sp.]